MALLLCWAERLELLLRSEWAEWIYCFKKLFRWSSLWFARGASSFWLADSRVDFSFAWLSWPACTSLCEVVPVGFGAWALMLNRLLSGRDLASLVWARCCEAYLCCKKWSDLSVIDCWDWVSVAFFVAVAVDMGFLEALDTWSNSALTGILSWSNSAVIGV